ncbi:TPA: hypothetical protein RZH60_000452 [Campylobacter coli]|nr:hypothetical protein [Campylobacter coli]
MDKRFYVFSSDISLSNCLKGLCACWFLAFMFYNMVLNSTDGTDKIYKIVFFINIILCPYLVIKIFSDCIYVLDIKKTKTIVFLWLSILLSFCVIFAIEIIFLTYLQTFLYRNYSHSFFIDFLRIIMPRSLKASMVFASFWFSVGNIFLAYLLQKTMYTFLKTKKQFFIANLFIVFYCFVFLIYVIYMSYFFK